MKKKRKVLATWKVVLITIAAIIGLLGVSTFVMYLLGYFNEEVVNPENISFVQGEEYNAETGMYEVSSDFYMTITSSTEGTTVNNVTLSLGSTMAENGYLDNGIIRVPQTVRLNTPFLVTLSTLGSDYINGGITNLRATSDNRLIAPITATIAVDVPVSEITAFIYDDGDSLETPISDNEVIVGSRFKVGVNYSPERSEFMYSGETSKMLFYSPTNNYISFDYTTQTFTANDVSAEGYSDTIRVYTFTSAETQEEFLRANSDIIDNFEALNTAALNYFGANEGSDIYRTCVITVTVKDVGVASFNITNNAFEATVDKYFNLSSNSNSPVFDGSLGVAIRDEENNILNSAYAGLVGIAIYSQNVDVKVVGGSVMQVVVTVDNDTNESSYVVNELVYDENLSYLPTEEITENSTIYTYYFILPNTDSASSSANYNYRFASTSEENVNFKVALFVEGDNGYEIFYSGNSGSISDLPTVTISFEVQQEQNVYWNVDERLTIIYDSDAQISDTVDLSSQIGVPTGNVYQTVRYFIYSPTGNVVNGIENAIRYRSLASYTIGEDINLSGLDTGVNDVYLYELESSSLSAIGSINEDINLVFATVRTNADMQILNSDGEIYQTGDKYDIVSVSLPRALIIDATLRFGDMTGEVSFSSVYNNQFLYQPEGAEIGQLYVPAILYSDEVNGNDEFNITISFNNQLGISYNELQDLYNSGDLYIEFRDQNGNLSTYDDNGTTRNYFDIASLNFQGTDTITATASVTISDDFTDTVGIFYTPYLVYNNGIRTQSKVIDVTYGGENFTGFTVYAQLASDSEYYFVNQGDTRYDINEPINVSIESTGNRTITWNGTPIEDESTDRTALDILSELLSVVVFDQYGKVIYTNASSFTLQEEANKNYINIINNEIISFNSTGGTTQNTSINATINSIYGTVASETSPGTIQFSIYSAGVSRVEYDQSETVGETNYGVAGNMGDVSVKKYFTLESNSIRLDSLVRVFVGTYVDEITTPPTTEIRFRLNETFLNGLSQTARQSLFTTVSGGTPTTIGMITLKSDTGEQGENYNYDAQNIGAIQVNTPFAEDFELVFDIYDDYNIVNIQLTLTIGRNIQYADNFSSYSEEYLDYLTYGESGNTARKLVFGGDRISLNTYLPISYIHGDEGTVQWSEGNTLLYVNDTLVPVGSSSNGIGLISEGNEVYLTFDDVKTLTTVEITLYYSRQSDYSLRVALGFVINPNYLLIQTQNFVDLSRLSDTEYYGLSNFYELYNAKEYIDYYILEKTQDRPTAINFNDNVQYGMTNVYFTIEANGLLQVGAYDGDSIISGTELIGNTGERLLYKASPFEAPLGAVVNANINLMYHTDSGNVDCEFIFLDEDNIQLACSTFNFEVGYGESVESIIQNIFNENSVLGQDYNVLENDGEYVLVLLEYNTYQLNDGWTAVSDSNLLPFQNNQLSVSQLTVFNTSANLTFTYNQEDSIYVDVRLTKVGLIYVAYEKNYNGEDNTEDDFAFDDITTDATGESELNAFFENMAELGIYDSYIAGNSYQIVFNEFDESVTKPSHNADNNYGFYYRSATDEDTSVSLVTPTLSVYSVTSGYEDLISVSGTSIILNSFVSTGEDVFAVLELTLNTTLSGNNITYVMYYRIKIEPNFTLGDVTYPYNSNAEYVQDASFTIDFEKPFTSQDASLANVGKTRFAELVNTDLDVTTIEGLSFKYSIYEVIVNGETSSDYSSVLSLSIDENTGILQAEVLDTDANITIRIAKTYLINDIQVVRSQRIYTIIYNGIPTYIHTVEKIDGEDLIELDKIDGNYQDDDISINGTYNYQITIQEKIGDVQRPTVDVYAHITSVKSGYTIQDYLYEFVKLADQETLNRLISSNDGSGNISYTLGTPFTFEDATGTTGNYVTILEAESVDADRYAVIFDEITIDGVEGYVVVFNYRNGDSISQVSNGDYFFLPKENVNDFDFRSGSTNGVFNLTFLTKDEIKENGEFSIGVYTTYLNLFDINFSMDGGYVINYAQDFTTPVSSGNDYSITRFITSINKDTVDVYDEFRFTINNDDENRVILSGTGRNTTFHVAHTQEDFTVEVLAERVVNENVLTIPENTSDPIQIYTNYSDEQFGSSYSISDIVFENFTYATSDVTIGDVSYTRIDLSEERLISTTTGSTVSLTTFYILDSDVESVGGITTQENFMYQFYFTLNFTSSNAISVGQTITYQESESVEGIRYSQNTIELNLSDVSSSLYNAIVSNFEVFRTSGNIQDSLTFENGSSMETIQLENVGETTEREENFVIQYRFGQNGGDVIYTFNLRYVFEIEPNVTISSNYPTPDTSVSEEERMTEEYLDNGAEITDFFNTQASFTTSDALSRFDIRRKDMAKNGSDAFENSYTYDYTLDITTITNVSLVVNGVTYTDPTEIGTGIIGEDAEGKISLPTFNLTFNLRNTGTSGRVLFTLQINNVTATYSVVVSNNDVVTIKTNPISTVEDYEEVFAEDIATYDNNKLFSYGRILRYNFLENTSGTYYLRFNQYTGEEITGHLIRPVTVTTRSVDVLEDLGSSYDGYEFDGVYRSNTDAINRYDVIDWATLFSRQPEITSRIILLYAGQEIKNNVAVVNLSLNADNGFKSMNDITFDATQVSSTSRYYIGYTLTRDATSQLHTTNYSYRIRLNVRFEVTSDATSHYETIEVQEGSVSLWSFANLGIVDAKTGSSITASDIGITRQIDLEVYGVSRALVNNSEDSLTQEAWNVHTSLIRSGHSTGLVPRYGETINSDHTFGNGGLVTGETQEANYLSLNAGDEYGSNWQIIPNGAAADGNYVMVRITYTTYLDRDRQTPVSVSANLRFLIMPSYSISFKSDTQSNDYTFVSDLMEIDGEMMVTNYGDPYVIRNNSESSLIHYLYSPLVEDPIWRVTLNDNNYGYIFDYSIPIYNTASEYNGYTNLMSFNGEDPDNLWIGEKEGESATDWLNNPAITTYGSGNDITSNSQVFFNIEQIDLGDKNFYIDMIDNYGFRVRMYFRLEADITPIIYNTNTTLVTEGASAQIGAAYREVTFQGGTINDLTPIGELVGDLGSGSFTYDYSYTITGSDPIVITYLNEAKEIGIFFDPDDPDNPDYSDHNRFDILYTYTTNEEGENVTYASNNFKDFESYTPASYNVYLRIKNINDDGLLFGVATKNADGELSNTIAPNQIIYSTTTLPSYGDGTSLQFTIGGLTVNAYSTNVIPAISDNSFLSSGLDENSESNVQDIKISDVWFEVEYNGEIERVDISQTDKKNLALVSAGTQNSDRIIYKDDDISTAINPSNAETFTIPHFSGKYYGTNTTINNVVMVVNFSSATDDNASNGAQLRQTLSITRTPYGTLNIDSLADGDSITYDDFEIPQSGSSTGDGSDVSVNVYNDTVEIELMPSESLEYAVVQGVKTSLDESDNITFKPLTNDRDYGQREQIRLSTTDNYLSDNTLNTKYTLIIRNASSNNFKVKYFSEEETADAENSNLYFYNITLSQFSNNNSNSITFNIEDVSELNQSNYVTRYFYTIIEANYGEEKGTEYYQQNESFRLYPRFSQITSNQTSTLGFVVDDYYRVGTEDSYYYVISPTSWAGNDHLNYYDYINTGVLGGGETATLLNYEIANQPYIFTFSVDTGGSIDANGTIYTTSNFRIGTDTIRVYVRMRVSGIDGQFNDTDGILLNDTYIEFTLRNSSPSAPFVTADSNQIYVVGANSVTSTGADSSLIILNNGESVSRVGSASETNRQIYPTGDTTVAPNVGTYLVSHNENFNFAERFDSIKSSGANNSFKIVQENSSSTSYLSPNYNSSYQYTNSGSYLSMFVEIYRVGSAINYRVFTATILSYDEALQNIYSAEYSTSSGATSSTFKQNEGNNVLTLQVGETAREISGKFYDLKSGKEIVETILNSDGGNAVDSENNPILETETQITFAEYLNQAGVIETKDIIVLSGSNVNYYRITFYKYTLGENFEVSFMPNRTYTLSNLLPSGTYYQIDDQFRESTVTLENYSSVPNVEQQEVYYVYSGNSLTKYNVTFKLYNSQNAYNLTTWVEQDNANEALENTATISVAGDGGLFEKLGYSNVTFNEENSTFTNGTTEYKIYEILNEATSNRLQPITSNSYVINDVEKIIGEDGTVSYKYNPWLSILRNFFVEVIETSQSSDNTEVSTTFNRYNLTFYKYVQEVNISAVTSYTAQFMLRNLDSLVLKELGQQQGTSVTWWIYLANGTLNSTTYISILENNVIDGKYDTSGQEFYVIVGDAYYKINLDITCAAATSSLRAFVVNQDLSAATDLESINLHTFLDDGTVSSQESLIQFINRNIGLPTTNGTFQVNDIEFYNYSPNSYAFDVEDVVSTVDLSGNLPFAKSYNFVYKVNYTINTNQTYALYAILNIVFVVQENPINRTYFFDGTISGSTFDLNTITTQVRQKFNIASTFITYYQDISDVENPVEYTDNKINLTEEERSENYILKELYIRILNSESVETFEKIILILENTNIISTSNVITSGGGN